MHKCPQHHVRLQVKQNLVISVYSVPLKHHKRRLQPGWVSLDRAVEPKWTLHDEAHLVEFVSMGHYDLAFIVFLVSASE